MDFLRFFAGVGIIILHSHEFWFAPSERPHVAMQGLALFVDLFFVISGYVMGFVYGHRMRSAGDYFAFLWRRVARLYPLHLVLLTLNIAVWAILLTHGRSIAAPSFSPACIASTALLVQEFIPCGSPRIFNGVVWSVSVEMGLYVLFPLLVLAAARGRKWLLLIAIASIALTIALLPHSAPWTRAPHLARGLAGFSLGFLLFSVREGLPDIPHAGGLVLVLVAAVLSGMIAQVPQFVVLMLIAALAVVAASADRHGRVHPWIDRLSPLGQLTYSMYIWHRVIVLVLMNVVADKLFGGNLLMLIAMTLLAYATVFGASYLGYFAIEVPVRRRFGDLFRRRRNDFPARTSGLVGL